MNQEDKEYIGSSPCPMRLTQLNQSYRRELDGSLVNEKSEKEDLNIGSSASEWIPRHPCELFGATGLSAMLNFPARQQPSRTCKKKNRELMEPNSNVNLY